MIVVRRVRPGARSRRRSNLDPFSQAFAAGNASGPDCRRGWQPSVEMYETHDAVEIVAEIAGMDGQDIDVVIEGDIVSIQGKRLDQGVEERRLYHVANIGYGPFSVDIRMPRQIDADGATANYDNGFLRLTLPKVKSRTIVPTRVGNIIDVDEEKNA